MTAIGFYMVALVAAGAVGQLRSMRQPAPCFAPERRRAESGASASRTRRAPRLAPCRLAKSAA